jgi:chromosomal replication initiator protein
MFKCLLFVDKLSTLNMVDSFWSQFLVSNENIFNKEEPLLYTFLKQLKPLELQENKISIGCENRGLKIFLDKKIPFLEELLEKYTGKKISLDLIILTKNKKIKEAPLLSFEPSIEDILINAGFSRRYSFDNFAVSLSNQVAFAAAQAVVNNLGTAYNPLFLYGGVGVGKTHLAQAIGRKVLENDDKKKILFSPGDLFTNELIESIRGKNTPLFRKKYRRLNLLIIDDVQFIAGKQTVQEEFFHTFNSIVSLGGQVILTSDRPPGEIKNLEDRLRSRFSGGLMIDIQPPDFELRTAILLIKAQEKNIKLDIDSAKMIAEKVLDTRALEGTLLSLYAKVLGKKEEIDLEATQAFFSDQRQTKAKKISPNEVVREVCSYYNIRASKIRGTTKESNVALPRQLIMYILRKHLDLKLDQVAFFLNRKDHTTVMHAIKKISRLIAKDPMFKQDVNNILSSLNLST